MTRVGLVCDSTCDLGPQWLAEHDVAMVPLKVLFGSESYPRLDRPHAGAVLHQAGIGEGASEDIAAVSRRLRCRLCRPRGGRLQEIVSIHLTSALSGTFESATLAAVNSPVPCESSIRRPSRWLPPSRSRSLSRPVTWARVAD
jgi:fatty acid-binding protein DegV